MDGFSDCFEGLEDPRTGNAGRHDLHELLLIALCTVLCGGQTAVDMALFAEAKEEFLRGFMRLEHGVPSHDTFSRLFRLLDPEQFRACFQRFMARFSESCRGVVAIDGKVLRRSFDKASGKSPLHMVSAWGCERLDGPGAPACPQQSPWHIRHCLRVAPASRWQILPNGVPRIRCPRSTGHETPSWPRPPNPAQGASVILG